ncbi:MAG: CAP domain-containing protein [Chloroflexota bacterium]|jgi:uncharacterized protein YkwD
MERRILISLVVAISLFATFAVGNVAAAVAPLSEQELSLLNHLNAERMNHGMAPLELDPALLELARGRCFDMAHRNYFSHVTPDGTTVFDQMNAWRLPYRLAGENISMGYYDGGAAHWGFMHSPSHRGNMLNPGFNKVGVGFGVSPSGTPYFAQVFANMN